MNGYWNIARSGARPCRGIAAACGLLVLAGCASLDPAGDIAEASALVTERSGADTGWTASWFDPAEAWDGRSPLSSDAAVRVALQNNREIRRQVESIAAARADLVQAHLLPNPVINVAVGFPTDGIGGTPLMASFVQQLAWLWKRPIAIEAAESELQAQVLAVSDAALRLVERTRRAHARVFFAEQAVALQVENIELLERSAALLRDQFAVGEASRLDLNRVELDVRAAGIQLADRRSELGQARRAMLGVLGRADASVDWTTDPTSPPPTGLEGELDEASIIRLALEQRLDVAAADATVEARAAGVDLQERDGLPDVSAGAGFERNFSDREGVFPSLQISPRIFDDNSARIARAAAELRQAIIEADGVRQVAVAEARQAWVNLGAQQNIIRDYRDEILALAASNLDLAGAAFEAGETDLTVLLQSQRRYNDARIELIDRQRAAAELRIALERAAGGALHPLAPDDSALVSTATEPATDARRQEVAP